MQEKILFGELTDMVQPDHDGYSPIYATTSTEDSERSMSGKMHNTPIFTVAGYNFKFSNIKASEASKIIRQFLGRGRFKAHYYDIVNARWTDGYFYISGLEAGSVSLKEGEECWSSLTFDMRSSDAV